MTTYRVKWSDSVRTVSGGGGWVVSKSGKFVDSSSTKRAALSQGKRQAKKWADTSGEDVKLIVEKKSGATQDTFTYEGDGVPDPLGGLGL